MRPFPQVGRTISTGGTAEQVRSAALPLLILLAASVCGAGCAAVGKGTGTIPTPTPTLPPPLTPVPVRVAVTPESAAVILGNTQTFTATVTDASNTNVLWSVNGVPGGTAATGTITAAGVYTAPADLPATTSVQVDGEERRGQYEVGWPRCAAMSRPMLDGRPCRAA